MAETDEPLVLYLDKPKLLRALRRRMSIVLPVSVAAGALVGPGILAPLSPLVSAAWGGLFYALVSLLIWASMIVWSRRLSAPLVTLTRQGIAFRLPWQSGFLRWEEVERVTLRRVRGTRLAFCSVALALTSPRAFLHVSPAFLWRQLWIILWPSYLLALRLPRRRAPRAWNLLGAIHIPDSYLPMSAEDFARAAMEYRSRSGEGAA